MKFKVMILIIAALLSVALILGVIIFVLYTDKSTDQSATPEPTAQSTDAPSVSDPTAAPTEPPTEAPTPAPLANYVIGIDAGHQSSQNIDKEPCAPWGPEVNDKVNNTVMKTKTTAGTVGKFSNVPEYVVTLQIALKLKARLEALGATVVMSRETNDVDISNIERAEMGNAAGCDVVIRIHCNGYEKEAVNGVEAWIRDKGDGTEEYKALGSYEKDLAAELLTYFCEATGANKRNVNRSDNYAGLNWSTVPAIILECGFLSNEEEDYKLTSDSYQDQIAEGITNWIRYSKILKHN